MPAVPKSGSSRDKFRLDPYVLPGSPRWERTPIPASDTMKIIPYPSSSRRWEGTPTPPSSDTDEIKFSYEAGVDEYPKPTIKTQKSTIGSSSKVSGDLGVGGNPEKASHSGRRTGSRRDLERPRPALKSTPNRLDVIDLLDDDGGDGGDYGEGPSEHNSQQSLGQVVSKPESALKVQPAFGLAPPFDKLPESITMGFELLTAMYSTHHAASCIADCIRDLTLVIDLQDSAVELALIMVMVLGSPSPLPRVTDSLDSFQRHTKHGKAKSQWRAVLFIKMMWYRYRDLMTADVKDKFTSYQGQQRITTFFLLKIGWVVTGVQQGSSLNKQARQDHMLIPEGVTRRKLEMYKKLIIEGDSFGLARKIFNGDSAWAEMAVEGFKSPFKA